MSLTLPGSDFERLGAEEWPCVERASCGPWPDGCVDGAAETFLDDDGCDGAGVGSRLGSGSGGGSARTAAEEPDEVVPDVLIGSGVKLLVRSFLFFAGEPGVMTGFTDRSFSPSLGRPFPRLVVGGEPSGLYCVPASA